MSPGLGLLLALVGAQASLRGEGQGASLLQASQSRSSVSSAASSAAPPLTSDDAMSLLDDLAQASKQSNSQRMLANVWTQYGFTSASRSDALAQVQSFALDNPSIKEKLNKMMPYFGKSETILLSLSEGEASNHQGKDEGKHEHTAKTGYVNPRQEALAFLMDSYVAAAKHDDAEVDNIFKMYKITPDNEEEGIKKLVLFAKVGASENKELLATMKKKFKSLVRARDDMDIANMKRIEIQKLAAEADKEAAAREKEEEKRLRDLSVAKDAVDKAKHDAKVSAWEQRNAERKERKASAKAAKASFREKKRQEEKEEAENRVREAAQALADIRDEIHAKADELAKARAQPDLKDWRLRLAHQIKDLELREDGEDDDLDTLAKGDWRQQAIKDVDVP